MTSPPPGVAHEYDYSDPFLRTPNIALAAVGMIISTACLAVRLYTKAFFLHQIGWDDACIVTAWIFAAASQGVLINAYANAWIGIHLWNMTSAMVAGYRKTTLTFWTLYIVALAFSKIAVLMLYRRLFTGTRLRQFTISLTVFTIAAYSFAFVVALILACSPIRKAWDTELPGSCMPRTYIYLGTTIANTVSDIILILIPIPVVHQLHLPFIEKVVVMFMFGAGCLTIGASIVRMATVIPLIGAVDQTYDSSLVVIFIMIEANFIIVCGTLPYLRHFARHYCACLNRERSQKGNNHISSDDTMKWKQKLRYGRPEYDIELAMRSMNGEEHVHPNSWGATAAIIRRPEMAVHR
ncbi:hypothetical protein BJX70DRAFT_396110 [Aspergillus crustosus]